MFIYFLMASEQSILYVIVHLLQSSLSSVWYSAAHARTHTHARKNKTFFVCSLMHILYSVPCIVRFICIRGAYSVPCSVPCIFFFFFFFLGGGGVVYVNRHLYYSSFFSAGIPIPFFKDASHTTFFIGIIPSYKSSCTLLHFL